MLSIKFLLQILKNSKAKYQIYKFMLINLILVFVLSLIINVKYAYTNTEVFAQIFTLQICVTNNKYIYKYEKWFNWIVVSLKHWSNYYVSKILDTNSSIAN